MCMPRIISNMEFQTEEEYQKKYTLFYGSYKYHRDRLLDLYERNNITLDEFITKFTNEASPYLQNCRNLAEILVSGLNTRS